VSSCYELIEAEETSFPVQLMCRMLVGYRSPADFEEGRMRDAKVA
jgi:hypothetical protein